MDNLRGGVVKFAGVGGAECDLIYAEKTQDWGSIAAQTSAVTTVPVQGVKMSDRAFVVGISMSVTQIQNSAEVIFTGYISADNTVTVVGFNTHAANAADLASGTLRVCVMKLR